MIRIFFILFLMIGCSDEQKAKVQKVPQVHKIIFEGVNLLPFNIKDYKTTLYNTVSFLGGTWYVVSIDSSQIDKPLEFLERKYLDKGWDKKKLSESRRSWNLPLKVPYMDSKRDLLFFTDEVNTQFGATVRVSHREETQELFFYIVLPK